MDKSIQNIITDTLSHIDFVCIPELGTFLVQKEASTLDYKLGIATPPYKQVVFNTEIKPEDSHLSGLIARAYSITEDEAKKELNDFVKSVNTLLYSNGAFHFDKLGTLLLSNNSIRFEQDTQINIDSDSFGLSKVNFNQYVSQNQNLKLRPPMSKSESISQEKETAKKSSKKTVIWVSVLTPVVFSVAALGFLWENRQNHSYASVNPFFIASNTKVESKKAETSDFNYDDPMGRNTNADQVEKAERVNIESSTEENNTKVLSEAKESSDFPAVDQEKLAKNTVVIKAGEIVSGKSDRYYIICASFQTLKKAESVAKELEEQGYESVKILEPHGKVDRYRIALMDFENQKEASVKAKELRPKHGDDIWVYKY